MEFVKFSLLPNDLVCDRLFLAAGATHRHPSATRPAAHHRAPVPAEQPGHQRPRGGLVQHSSRAARRVDSGQHPGAARLGDPGSAAEHHQGGKDGRGVRAGPPAGPTGCAAHAPAGGEPYGRGNDLRSTASTRCSVMNIA